MDRAIFGQIYALVEWRLKVAVDYAEVFNIHIGLITDIDKR